MQPTLPAPRPQTSSLQNYEKQIRCWIPKPVIFCYGSQSRQRHREMDAVSVTSLYEMGPGCAPGHKARLCLCPCVTPKNWLISVVKIHECREGDAESQELAMSSVSDTCSPLMDFKVPPPCVLTRARELPNCPKPGRASFLWSEDRPGWEQQSPWALPWDKGWCVSWAEWAVHCSEDTESTCAQKRSQVQNDIAPRPSLQFGLHGVGLSGGVSNFCSFYVLSDHLYCLLTTKHLPGLGQFSCLWQMFQTQEPQIKDFLKGSFNHHSFPTPINSQRHCHSHRLFLEDFSDKF